MSIAWEDINKSDKETQQFSANSAINAKIKRALQGLHQPSIQKLFLEFPTDRDKELVADFILACVHQENTKVGAKRAYLIALARLSNHVKGKSLEDMTDKDLTEYVDKMHKERSEDPDQSWINTQKAYGLPLQKFFKWLAYPQLVWLVQYIPVKGFVNLS
jgi:Phage integrase, N-terminal SAM-like domain